MSWVGFESTIPVFEREKTIHALYRAATVIGRYNTNIFYLILTLLKYLLIPSKLTCNNTHPPDIHWAC
jgi:hypothetical protein